ncbi:MAG: hypothetical protein JW838_14085 [Spirochaetes bacterium]|nr:hypothetical protein [Spirochaetota bacterium]
MKQSTCLALLFITVYFAIESLPGKAGPMNDDDMRCPAKPYDAVDTLPFEEGESGEEENPPLEERTYRRGGLVIKVRLMEREREAVDFELDIENPEAVRKTLRARLCLFDTRVRDRDCGSGEEPLYIDVKAKAMVTLKVRVRPRSLWEAWTLVIVKVHDK